MPVRLERVTPATVAIFREVRLRALQDTPQAFGRSYAEESGFDDAEWLRRAASSDGIQAITLIAFEDAEPCGLIRCAIDNDPAAAHVMSMWSSPDHRRKGIGNALLHAAETWAIERNVQQLFLMVVSNNESAARFYEANGFAATGQTEPYPLDPSIIQYEMSKPLQSAR